MMSADTEEDPGFPVGEGRRPILGGEWRGPPTRALFTENVCENERIGYRSRGRPPENFVCRSANEINNVFVHLLFKT